MENAAIMNIPKEKFAFCQEGERLSDKKLATKPVSAMRDVLRRFRKNKSSVVAAYIIVFLVLFAIFVPIVFANKYNTSLTDTAYLKYQKLLPKSKLFAWAGWDGAEDETINESRYLYLKAYEEETGVSPFKKEYGSFTETNPDGSTSTYYKVRLDSYIALGVEVQTVTADEYRKMQAWQDETGRQMIYPAVDQSKLVATKKNDGNVWFLAENNGAPILDENGNYQPIYRKGARDDYSSLRVPGDDGSYCYARFGGTSAALNYIVRVDLNTYFEYRYGEAPSFLFGTNALGQDILTRLAAGARFSLILAVVVASVNLLIGAIYGAIMGYYGGAVDLAMDRVLDILGGVPFMVVTTLFQLHLANKVGPVWSLLFAFFLTGWIGMAARVRMQFYRFKKQEYILAARTLGARDSRLMFKHIFPNAMGTIITGSILVIPGVIFSETSLTYLGIVNLESSTMTSVGTLLSKGQAAVTTDPHIVLFPAIFIALLEIAFNLFGNGLRDAFNPSLRGMED